MNKYLHKKSKRSAKGCRSLTDPVRMEPLEQRYLMSAALTGAVWTIRGDDNPEAPGDEILIERDVADGAVLHAFVNGELIDTVPASRVGLIRVFGGEGDDTVRIDLEGAPRQFILPPFILPPCFVRVTEVEGGITTFREESAPALKVPVGKLSRRPVRAHLYGGTGDDVLTSAGGHDLLYGGPGADRLYGGEGNDLLFGNDGDDVLEGGAGHDRLYGHAGADKLTGGDGNDLLLGYGGNDTLDGGAGIDYLYGHAGDDTLNGGEGRDLLLGFGGDDVMDGGAGNDVLLGYGGNDTLDGGAGIDYLYGHAGDDILKGGEGRDWLLGFSGDDVMDGGAGNDWLYGYAGADTLTGGDGDDWLFGFGGDDVMKGGAGNDRLYGYAGADTLKGGEGDDWLFGFGGHDLLEGGKGGDRLYGGSGNDVLRGGDGRDLLIPAAGKDIVYAHPDSDRLYVTQYDLLIDEQDGSILQAARPDEQLQQWFIEAAVQQWKERFGRPCYHGYYPDIAFGHVIPFGGDTGVTRITNSAEGSSSLASSGDHSDTNTQVVGVDEADIAETDGKYLYVLSGGELIILDAWPAKKLQVVSRVELEGTPRGMYLYGDRLTIVSGLSTGQLQVEILDVSVPTDPLLLEKTCLDGSLLDSRVVDDRLYLAIQNHQWIPDPEPIWNEENRQYVYESEKTYRQRLESGLGERLPKYTVWNGSEGGEKVVGSLIQMEHAVLPERVQDNKMLSLVMFDIDDEELGPITTTTVFGVGEDVYSSRESFYVVGNACGSWEVRNSTQNSGIYKFHLGKDEIPLEATGSVPGQILNQFSMDEHDGYFRVATTSRHGQLSSGVYVMAQEGDQLNVVGSVTGLGLTERIYSVRFMGEKGYVVTFRRVDPLFTLDLSNPLNPQMVGELKIPGFSCYLHPLGENHLIGFGRNRAPQLSLFDVSDMRNPIRTDLYQFARANSEAESDHHAFAYFPESGVLSVPMAKRRNDPHRLEVFHITPEDGINYLGKVAHDAPVRRSLRIGKFLYSVSDSAVKVNSIADPEQQVAAVDLSDSNG